MDRAGEKGKGGEDDEVIAVEIVERPGGDAGAAPAPRRSRRCVQKKLDLHGPRGGLDDPQEEYDDSDSGMKGKRKRKVKGNQRTAAPRKASPSKKEIPEFSKKASNFFMKASEKKLQWKLESKQGSEQPQLPHDRARDSSNPKDVTPKQSKSPCSRQKVSTAESTITKSPGAKLPDKNQPVLDLWFQARVDAEENQRLSAGRQIHPFFTNCKAYKKMAEISEIDEVQSSSLTFDDQCPPIHVLNTHEETVISLNWRSWDLSHVSLLSSDDVSALDCTFAEVLDGSVEPLRLGHSFGDSNLKMDKELCQDPLSVEMKKSTQKAEGTLSLGTSSQDDQHLLLPYLEGVLKSGDTNHASEMCIPNDRFSCMQDKRLQERLKSHQLDHGSHSDQSLWTNKYRPEKASEVCGNVDAVRVISDWLLSWHEQFVQRSKTIDKSRVNADNSSFQTDSETDFEDEEDLLGNVLLVTGPIGCGKSAAIYACAKEHGYEVIEVNASDQRNGTLIKQKFGEATESHGLDICSVIDLTGQERSASLNFNLSHEENIETTSNDPEVTSWTCEKDFKVHDFHGNTAETKATICQVTSRCLLLFEDVDTVFDEDRGFLGTIVQLAQTSKRPIVLTTNSKEPGLPRLLVRHLVDFTFPSHEELLSLMSLICAAEEVQISPLLLGRLIRSCQDDIRKTILHLQFWCQGQCKHTATSLLQFDLRAAHLVAPQIFPMHYPCKLAHLVEEEITKTYLAVEENPSTMYAVTRKNCSSSKYLRRFTFVSTEMDVNASDAGIRSHCIVNSKGTLSPLNDDDTSDISCSPVKFSRRSRKLNSNSVFSSESGEEHSKDFVTVGNGSQLFADNLSPDVSLVPLSYLASPHDNSNQVNDPGNFSERKELLDCPLWHDGIGNVSNVSADNVSANASCIPESEFVFDTEGDCMIDHVSFTFNEAYVCPLNLMHTSQETCYDNDASKSHIHSPRKDENACLYTESVHGTEDLHDLEGGISNYANIGGQFVDECSRADFNSGCVPDVKESFSKTVESMQDTWTRLRNSREDLKSYLTSDQKAACQTLKLVAGMTNLISDADIMLSDCISLTNDFLQPSMMPCNEPHSICWYEQQLEMASIFGQHGFCHYAKTFASLDLEVPHKRTFNLSEEILGCSSNLMALGKLLCQESACSGIRTNLSMSMPESTGDSCTDREEQMKLRNTILPMVPLRACMCLKGHAFHEYLSSLSHISKLENSRLSQRIDGERRQRRVRASQHYLQSFPLSLSPADVTLLSQQCCFGSVGFG